MGKRVEQCGWTAHWAYLIAGAGLGLVGALFTATILGAIIGIPLMLLVLPLLKNPVVAVPCV